MRDGPTVSLSMIVKDAVGDLERCLDSIEPFVDEIVVVDTGSTDGTWELVEQRASVFEQVEWNGFAAARNRSLELCSGEYILVIDADEYLLEGAVSQMVGAMDDGASAVAVLVRSALPDGHVVAAEQIWQVRMFRNDPEIRWAGRVHNRIADAIERKEAHNGRDPVPRRVPVVFFHEGYRLSVPGLKKKYEGRLELLRYELDNAADERLEAYYRYHLSNACYMLQDRRAALEWAETVDTRYLPAEAHYDLALTGVYASCVESGDGQAARGWARVMLDLLPDEPLSHVANGLAHLLEDREAAYRHLSSALSMADTAAPGLRYRIDTHIVAGAAGTAALNLGRHDDARRLFRHHLEKYTTPGIANLERLLSSQLDDSVLLAPPRSK